jgi:hypothetical protein
LLLLLLLLLRVQLLPECCHSCPAGPSQCSCQGSKHKASLLPNCSSLLIQRAHTNHTNSALLQLPLPLLSLLLLLM